MEILFLILIVSAVLTVSRILDARKAAKSAKQDIHRFTKYMRYYSLRELAYFVNDGEIIRMTRTPPAPKTVVMENEECTH